MPARPKILPLGLTPRGVTLQQAAAIAGVSVGVYNSARAVGTYPGPTLPGGRVDLNLLYGAMDRLSGLVAERTVSDPLADWERRHGYRDA